MFFLRIWKYIVKELDLDRTSKNFAKNKLVCTNCSICFSGIKGLVEEKKILSIFLNIFQIKIHRLLPINKTGWKILVWNCRFFNILSKNNSVLFHSNIFLQPCFFSKYYVRRFENNVSLLFKKNVLKNICFLNAKLFYN